MTPRSLEQLGAMVAVAMLVVAIVGVGSYLLR
jgi:hypothetical protein